MDDNDALLKAFVEESREHLATIEADLLVIEEGGADINEDLVNKVFRAAHSIKGGSGFFGLENVKQLAHKSETVLDMLRSRKISPNAEITNVLLAAFDQLRVMINDTRGSESADIADLVAGLTSLSSAHAPAAALAPALPGVAASHGTGAGTLNPGGGPTSLGNAAATVDTCAKPDWRATSGEKLPWFVPTAADLEKARARAKYVYRIHCDLIEDLENKGRDLAGFFHDIGTTAEILDCALDTGVIGGLENAPADRVPAQLVIATVLDPELIPALFAFLPADRIEFLDGPHPPAPPWVSTAAVTTAAGPIKAAGPGPGSVDIENARNGLPKPSSPKPATASSVEDTLRVNVALLDTLMNLAGELVLSRNQVRAAVAQGNGAMLASAEQRINQVTSELQDVIMQTRLQPINNVFAKFPRLVRDLSRSLGKEIILDVQGKDVALDKTLIEGLSDPLTHMMRNAVDHGIESPEERLAAGKASAGTVRIAARYDAGQVVVEVADDGKGLDPQRLSDAALRKGLITAEKLLGMSDGDKQALIFLPGLSTAKQVSDVSGRGVGMDVVKTNLDRLGGQVEIISLVGKGSTFRIKLPLTLAIIPSLIISAANERFAIPQANIEELLRLRPEDIKMRVEVIGDRDVLLLRDRILPLAHLVDIIGAVSTYVDPLTRRVEIDRRVRVADRRSPHHKLAETPLEATVPAGPAIPTFKRGAGDRRRGSVSSLEIAVVNTGVMTYGLVVGTFHETEEVVVKPLGRRLKHLREYSGATILGDGTVALILDIPGLAAKGGLVPLSATTRAQELAVDAEALRAQDTHTLLLFRNGPGEHCALPLDLVQRIEQIKPAQVERLGNRRSMQYRGNSLPLVALSDTAQVDGIEQEENLVVLVSSANGHEVGLLGCMPVDVIEDKIDIDQNTHRQKGITGSALVRGHTTLIADLYELVDSVFPEWGAPREARRAHTKSEQITVLLAEDSDFFRAQVKKYLEEDGFKVLAAPDGEAAWDLLSANTEDVSIVVTDIEMPRLTGLGLAARIRADERTSKLPIIAVTSLAAEEDVARGKAAGITEYQAKLDREQLLASVHSLAVLKGNTHAG